MTAKDTLIALGGNAAVAKRLGLVTSAVRNWTALDYLPPRHYLEIAAMAEEKKVFLDRSLFMSLAQAQARARRPRFKGEASDGKAAAQ